MTTCSKVVADVLAAEDAVWALSLESDGPARPKSVRLARQLDRDLDAWTWRIPARASSSDALSKGGWSSWP
jgi:hypothetical protein